MHPNEIRAMTDAEIETAIETARREMFKLRFQKATGRMADTSRARAVRRDVARLLTVRRERELWTAYQQYAEGEE